MGDAVRGKDYLLFENDLQMGILLHRWIDTNLDSFGYVQGIRQEIRNDIGLYSPVVIDVLLDHFRAKFFDDLGIGILEDFERNWVKWLEPFESFMSKRLLGYYRAMSLHHWFISYANLQNTQEILNQMALRLPKSDGLQIAAGRLPEYAKRYESEYASFWLEFQRAFCKIQGNFIQNKTK